MAHQLRPGLSFGLIDDQAVFLDRYEDRYFQLSPAITRVLVALSGPRPSALDPDSPLSTRGILVNTPNGRAPLPVCSILPQVSALEAGPQFSRTPSLSTAGYHLLRSRFLLSTLGLGATLERCQKLTQSEAVDAVDQTGFAQRFAVHRSHLPFNAKCLPNSLALHALLSRNGIRSNLVFGIRLQPFAAHCWVQMGPVVLSDLLDDVLKFTPVCRL